MNYKIISLLSLLALTSGVACADVDSELRQRAQDIEDWIKVTKKEFIAPIDTALKKTEEALKLAGDATKKDELLECLSDIEDQLKMHYLEKAGLKAQIK